LIQSGQARTNSVFYTHKNGGTRGFARVPTRGVSYPARWVAAPVHAGAAPARSRALSPAVAAWPPPRAVRLHLHHHRPTRPPGTPPQTRRRRPGMRPPVTETGIAGRGARPPRPARPRGRQRRRHQLAWTAGREGAGTGCPPATPCQRQGHRSPAQPPHRPPPGSASCPGNRACRRRPGARSRGATGAGGAAPCPAGRAGSGAQPHLAPGQPPGRAGRAGGASLAAPGCVV
jgi:hypothetical protein